jgi:hypothetical protein
MSNHQEYDDMEPINIIKTYRKIRKDWGKIKPATRVEKNKKSYNRNKENREWRKELDGSI